MIDPRSERAVYRQLADLLRASIDRGDLQPGEPLASEAAIGQTYGVGRDTVRRALRVLRDEGLVETERGYRARVRRRRVRETVRVQRGSQVVSRPPTHAELEDPQLDLQDGEWVVVVTSGGRDKVYAAHRARLTFS